MFADKTEELLARQEICDRICRYMRAIDRMDEDLLRSVFHPHSQHSHFYEGPSTAPGAAADGDTPPDFVAFALGLLGTYVRTHHQQGNTLIDFLDEKTATVETYFTAHHRMRAKGDPLAAANAYDTEMDFFVGGRYLDRFELAGGEWKIAKRTGLTDWMRLESPCAQGFGDIAPETLGQRAPDDLVYGS